MDTSVESISPCHRIEFNELDRIVSEVYGHDHWHFTEVNVFGNDSVHLFKLTSVPKDEALSEYYVKEWARWLVEGHDNSGMVRIILNDLCKRGILPEGTLIVNVCW